jgi:adenosine deaminase
MSIKNLMPRSRLLFFHFIETILLIGSGVLYCTNTFFPLYYTSLIVVFFFSITFFVWHLFVFNNEKRTLNISSTLFTLVVLLISTLMLVFSYNWQNGSGTHEKAMDAYFEDIRKDNLSLTAFLRSMPKGGDLHHHYSGSVYAETFWKALVAENGWINTKSLKVDSAGATHSGEWKRCRHLSKTDRLQEYRQLILQQWSVKDYFTSLEPSDKHFFDAFGKFGVMSGRNIETGLLELKKRAKNENVQYIETMLSTIDTPVLIINSDEWNKKFIDLNSKQDSSGIQEGLNSVYQSFRDLGIFKAVNLFCSKLNRLHRECKLDDSSFQMRYLTYTNRTVDPIDCFRKLLLAFAAAESDSLIVGVNILSPEDNEISLRDYRLHMEMFRFCHGLYPKVKYSMHAGELSPGLVPPEDLLFHVSDAVKRAGANRIGHGVDIAYEKDVYSTLKTMREKGIAVELNLSSNEYILKIKGDEHPILLYNKSGVPIVISSDDAGILRTDLSNQFILLAKRYPSLHYADIKNFIRNSIRYSFLGDSQTKSNQLNRLDDRLTNFEMEILKRKIY